jgi:hypothetical protein
MSRDKDAIRYMIQSEGWQLIEQFMQARIDDSKNKLMSCELEKVPEHRAAAKALESVFFHIKQIVNEGNEEDAEIS